MKWYQHIYGPIQSSAKYIKNKIYDKGSEEYYKNRARKGKITYEESEHYIENVYKLPDYSNLNKSEKAKSELKYMRKLSSDVDTPVDGTRIAASLDYVGFSRKLQKKADWYEQETNDPDFKAAFSKSTELFNNWRNERRKEFYGKAWKEYKNYDKEISGLYLRKLGFEDTPASREAIEEYWKID